MHLEPFEICLNKSGTLLGHITLADPGGGSWAGLPPQHMGFFFKECAMSAKSGREYLLGPPTQSWIR